MTDTALESELGPIDYLIVEWPKDKPPTGDAFPHLVELVDRGLIRVLDFGFVRKADDGQVTAVRMSDTDLDGEPELALFMGASSGIIGDEDYEEAGSAIEPGCAAAVLVYENSWAAPFASALRRGGAQIVGNGRIPTQAILAAIDELEETEATAQPSTG